MVRLLTRSPAVSAPPRSHLRAALAGLLGLALAPVLPACKSTAGATKSPTVVDDDIEAIERQLASNARDLRAQGIVIARRETKVVSTPEPVLDDSATDLDGDTDLGGDTLADDGDPPVTEAPVTQEESEDEDYAPAEPAPSDAFMESTSRVQRSKRRYSRTRKKRERSRCERICDLAETTCDLAEQICDLADRHVDEVRYEDACERAADQCRQASSACTNCEG